MEHENEIVGTVMVVMFDLFVIFFIYLFNHVSNIKTGWFMVLFLICLVFVCIWATYKVLAYWIETIRNRFNGKKEGE